MTKIRLQISDLLNNRFNLKSDGLCEQYEVLLPLWKEKEKVILKGLKQITGLDFARNIIDVFLINDGKGSISHPTIVTLKKDNQKNICVITHELIHSLLWDNKQGVNWAKKIQELYPKENKKTAIHIAVHAILMVLYYEVLEDTASIKKDVEDCQKWEDYKRAWEIVEADGYKEIIKKLQKV